MQRRTIRRQETLDSARKGFRQRALHELKLSGADTRRHVRLKQAAFRAVDLVEHDAADGSEACANGGEGGGRSSEEVENGDGISLIASSGRNSAD